MCVIKFQIRLRLIEVNFKVDIELCFSLKAENFMSPKQTYDATNMIKITLFIFDENNLVQGRGANNDATIKYAANKSFLTRSFNFTIPIQFKALKYEKPCNVIYARFP